MKLDYKKADKNDADLLIRLYNESFYDDYVRYGDCPAYGKSREEMEVSIEKTSKLIILLDGEPVGVISVASEGAGVYYLGCLCVLPKFQGKGIGTQAFQHMLNVYPDLKRITLITPADKEENIKFYTDKCGFKIDYQEMNGAVLVAHFLLVRSYD